MIGRIYHVSNAEQAVRAVLGDLLTEKDLRLPKGTSAEILGCTVVVRDPAANLIRAESRKFNYAYMMAESLWNLTNTRDISLLKRYMEKVNLFVADQSEGDRDKALWAYGPHIQHQVRYAMQLLRDDPTSRRAVASIDTNSLHREGAVGTPPCLVSVAWSVRDGALFQHVFMRSNDAWLGLPLDLMQFGFWGQMVASALRLPFRGYTHHVASMHLYERDRVAATLFVGQRAISATTPTPPPLMLDAVLSDRVYRALIEKDPSQLTEVEGRRFVSMMIGRYQDTFEEYNRLRSIGAGVGWPEYATK